MLEKYIYHSQLCCYNNALDNAQWHLRLNCAFEQGSKLFILETCKWEVQQTVKSKMNATECDISSGSTLFANRKIIFRDSVIVCVDAFHKSQQFFSHVRTTS